ncbi:TPA: hypothetical protein ACTW90_001680 [Raoultella ornithinolytica]
MNKANPGTDALKVGSHSSENLPAYRQALSDEAVSNKASAVDRIRARTALLVSYIPDARVPEDELSALHERIAGLPEALENNGHRSVALMNAHRRLRELEDRIYIPLRRAAAEQFEQLCRERPCMTDGMLLQALVGAEIDDYRARNAAASQNATLAALMRSSPRADILISLVRQRNDEYGVTVFSWRPLALPLQGV